MADNPLTPRPSKRRRAPRACDLCSRRSVRCQPSGVAAEKCLKCFEYSERCTFDRPVKKRGARFKDSRLHGSREEASATPSSLVEQSENEPDSAQNIITQDGKIDDSNLQQPFWRPAILCTQAQVMDLTEIYFEVVFPVFPFFHRPTLRRRVSRGEHMTDRPFFAAVMALCALSSARARDGALYSGRWDAQSLRSPTSEEYFHAAEETIPRNAPLSQDFDYMRAAALLAITAIQYGRPQLMSYHLSQYHSFVAVGGLHDEINWPAAYGLIEKEERRRLFWSTYTLDVFTAIVWGGIIRSREASSNVGYPIEVDDQMFNDTAYSGVSPAGGDAAPSWLVGWNFVTDLYRILEHCVDRLRRPHSTLPRPGNVQITKLDASPSDRSNLFNQVSTMYMSLPRIFKTTEPISCNLDTDLFSFQAANIAATVQLFRMAHLTNEKSSLEEKCQVAGEVIAGFASVPVAYLRAISTPLLHHLGGIGTILGAAFEDGMTESGYTLIRSVLLDLANLLANLEVDLFCPSGTSDKVRTQVHRIDEYMATQRTHRREETVGHVDMPEIDVSQMAHTGNLSTTTSTNESPQYFFPPELFEDWSWAFDLT